MLRGLTSRLYVPLNALDLYEDSKDGELIECVSVVS
jgi:hypothetical protein